MVETSKITLTPQQQAVVDHDDGPALVFAVAGAGKTTAMVYRIERLVRQKRAAPAQIMATSFGVANIADIRAGLSGWEACRAVDTRTLHSLGREIILQAQRLGHLKHLQLAGGEADRAPQRLFYQALETARRRQVDFVDELDGVDRQDFLDYVSGCKGNLQYADLAAAELPDDGRGQAQQAASPSPALAWYLDLYQLYESIRQEAGIVTFDDMLQTGWELLGRYPAVLAAMRRRYTMILVDEFQDINLAQFAILEQLTADHRNLMVIGDDDQTIYEWRGASPHFILTFADRFEAKTYVIDDNFRSQAGPLLLANRVISFNRQRQQKRLQLTRGLAGRTVVRKLPDVVEMSRQIVAEIAQLRQDGYRLSEIAVLVRLNAQTPPLEQALTQAGLPYRVSQPFYERIEIRTLIDYVRLAWLEAHMRGGGEISGAMGRSTAAAWRTIANRPKRYLNRQLVGQIGQIMRHPSQRPSLILRQVAAAVSHDWLRDHLLTLSDDLIWLASQLHEPAKSVLRLLDERLEYRPYLLESSGFWQTGAGRAAGVDAFIHYARGHGSTLDLMAHIRQLAAKRLEGAKKNRPAVTLSTIHKAKGLEWPVVFVPQLNDGYMPFEREGMGGNLEEERRLCYVAFTRPREHLYLYYTADEPPSPFLTESGWRIELDRLAKLREILDRPVASWQAGDVVTLLRLIDRLDLQRYFRYWWSGGESSRADAAFAVQRLAYAAAGYLGTPRIDMAWEDVALWEEIAPLPDGAIQETFPGLERLLSR